MQVKLFENCLNRILVKDMHTFMGDSFLITLWLLVIEIRILKFILIGKLLHTKICRQNIKHVLNGRTNVLVAIIKLLCFLHHT